MSNQTIDGFQGSQPFITKDNDVYNRLTEEELKLIYLYKKQKLKRNYAKYNKKQKLIKDIQKLKKLNEKIEKGIDIKKTKKPKTKIKTFEDYFEECIKNKKIPPDTPSYFRKALERAIQEHQQGIIKEKSSLENFANKYVIEGEPGVTPMEYFKNISERLKDFFRNHENIKCRLILVCLMERQIIDKTKGVIGAVEDKAYFNSDTHINLESSDVKKLLVFIMKNILNKLEEFQKNGSGWYFKEILNLEIHTVEYKPMKGSP